LILIIDKEKKAKPSKKEQQETQVILGIYSPQPPKQPLGVAAVDGRTERSGAPPDTVWCASHVTQPLGFGRG
jgi:hypothetical protein